MTYQQFTFYRPYLDPCSIKNENIFLKAEKYEHYRIIHVFSCDTANRCFKKNSSLLEIHTEIPTG